MEKEVHSVFFLTDPDSGPLNAGALGQIQELGFAFCGVGAHPPNSM
jgi:hypothetical protein